MTIQEITALLKMACEEIARHGAIRVDLSPEYGISVHIYDPKDLDKIPGEKTLKYIDHINRYRETKVFSDVRFEVYLPEGFRPTECPDVSTETKE